LSLFQLDMLAKKLDFGQNAFKFRDKICFNKRNLN